MRSKLLADENIPWPLVRLLRSMGLDVMWIPETSYRGISDREVVDLANSGGRAVLTRDSDFLQTSLRRRIRHGLIYVAEPVRRDNVERLARSIVKALRMLEKKPVLAVVTSTAVELYTLAP